MTGRTGRVVVLAVLAVVCALLTAACGGLPAASDVQSGLNVSEKVDQRARVDVIAPIKGGSQEVIARDFIRAGASFQTTDESGQVVGRAYLAPASVGRWKPTSSVTVYDASQGLSIEPLPASDIRITIDAVATIDSSGHYTELPPGAKRSVTFEMEQVDGEWRIDLPEAGFGLWLNSDDLDRVFSSYNLNYVAVGASQLVQDVVWLPSGPGVATALARAQLGPVPAYLEGAAETEVPASTKLAVDAVDIDASGTATVTLTSSEEVLEPERRRAMWAQFVATLLQLPAVTAVQLEVQGIGHIAVPNLPDQVGDLASLNFAAPGPLSPSVGAARRGTAVTALNPQDIGDGSQLPAPTPLPGTIGAVTVGSSYTGLALSADGSDLAAVARSREEIVRWRAGAPITLPAPGVRLTDPAYDDRGRLWVGGVAKKTSHLWTFPATDASAGSATLVSADWLTGRQILSVQISPDGTRAAVVSSEGSSTRLDVSGITRASDGAPIALATPYQQGQPLVGITTVTWLGPLELAVLASEKAGATLRPFDVALGGGVGLLPIGRISPEQLLVPPVTGAVSLTTRGGARGLIARTGSAVSVRVSSGWAVVPGVSDIVVGGA